ncbi:MAG: hypothetical protein DCF19_08685 [Pseudanabaena frigida]|uniref:Uncharacterized protein n=1 Tax=Pseudanabaena frigida TaxID=945775 RepID=A0A2W4WBU6_9CYAN|nr:MAG: hypothetical protein DCF19_08685 [Pseudanabaena frigida]
MIKFDLNSIEEYLVTKFEKSLFKASISYLSNSNDPLRFNSFAYSMRELYRHVLSRLSPEDQVIKCDWFNIKDSNEGKSTRKQKLMYAIQGGLANAYVIDELGIEVDDFWLKIKDSQDLLSKYTHVNEDTFDISSEDCDKFSVQILESLWTIFKAISDTRHEIICQLYHQISDEMIDTFVSNTMSEIDILSTHSYIDSVDIEEYKIIDIDSKKIYFFGNGNVCVSLNYGSSRDEPTELQDEFPFEVNFFSPVNDLKSIQINPEEIFIDTSSWFGDGDNDDELNNDSIQIDHDNSFDDF